MSKVNLVELDSVVNDVIKEEPFNHEDKVESTGNADLNWKIKVETEDYNLEDLHHVVDIKDEVPFDTHNQEIEPVHNHQSRKSTKRKLLCSLSEEEIISVVSKKPTLWNSCHNNYGCGNTLSIWQDVAQELGVSGEGLACKAKWDSIQEQYKNFKQSGENRQHLKRWKYFDKLSFLDPYLSSSLNLENNKPAAPHLLSAAEQKLNPMNIPVNNAHSFPMNFEQKDVKIKLEFSEIEHSMVEESSNITATQLHRVTADDEFGKQKDYCDKKIILLERLVVTKNERAAAGERSTAAVERKTAAKQRRAAAKQRRAAAKQRRAAAELRRADAEVRKAAAEVRKAAAEVRRVAVEIKLGFRKKARSS